MRLADVEIALRIGGDAAVGEELARIPAAAAERADLHQRLALEDVHLLVVTVGNEQVSLLCVVGESDIPHRAARGDDPELTADHGAKRLWRDDAFANERPVFAE